MFIETKFIKYFNSDCLFVRKIPEDFPASFLLPNLPHDYHSLVMDNHILKVVFVSSCCVFMRVMMEYNGLFSIIAQHFSCKFYCHSVSNWRLQRQELGVYTSQNFQLLTVAIYKTESGDNARHSSHISGNNKEMNNITTCNGV